MLEARTAAARRMMEAHHGGGGNGGVAAQHRHSSSYTQQEPGKALDRELEAAKERLRRIQLEREALHKQARGGAWGGRGAAAVCPRREGCCLRCKQRSRCAAAAGTYAACATAHGTYVCNGSRCFATGAPA